MATLVVAETKLLARSAEFVIVTLVMPVAFFLLFSEIFSNAQSGALDTATYMMVSMAAYGAISAALTTGSRVSLERKEGWLRQLRLTPLSSFSYIMAKALLAMLVALPVIALVLAVGMLIKGISVPMGDAAMVLGVMWLCTLPFAALGVLMGMASSPDAASAVTVTGFLGFSMLGGLFVPIDVLPSAMQKLAEYLPSFWMGEYGRNVLTGEAMDLKGIVVLAVWLVVPTVIVSMLWKKDSKRM